MRFACASGAAASYRRRMAARTYAASGAPDALEHARFDGAHPLTHERDDLIVEWVVRRARR